jgi:hypothetical protein
MSETTIPMVHETPPGGGLNYTWTTPGEIVHVLEKDAIDLEQASHGLIHRVEVAVQDEIHKIEAEVEKVVEEVKTEVKKVTGRKAAAKKTETTPAEDLGEALDASAVLK